MIIRRFGPLSCAKIAGVIYAILGLLGGAVFSVFAVLGMALNSAASSGLNKPIPPFLGPAMGIAAIIFFPIIYGIIGFVGALLAAWIYNLVAGKVGGIDVDIS